jgi:NTE family protein
MSPDAILASACLPTLHHAVIIDGIPYWDGGYSANPDIVTLATESPTADTLIVLVNPLLAHGFPTGAREIAAHANTLTFNAPLRREVEMVLTVRELSKSVGRKRTRYSGLARHRFHLVEAGSYTGVLSPDSKMKPDWGLFMHLFQAGRAEASAWLERNRASIGGQETVDLNARFLTGREPSAASWNRKSEKLPDDQQMRQRR